MIFYNSSSIESFLHSSPNVMLTQNRKYFSGINYYPFGMVMPERGFSYENYRFGFNGQMKIDEISGAGNHNTATFWEYDTRLGRRWNIDPVVKHDLSSYSTFANNPLWYVDYNGKDTVVIFDQATNPDNKRIYTAKIYVVKSGEVLGPYMGSSYPNDEQTANSLNTGWFPYNNVYGHKGGTQKGLNIVDENGTRTAPGTDPDGNSVTMTLVNVHRGVPPEDDPGGLNRDNRGSAGCPTICPTDAEGFFKNFIWTNRSETTGTSTGQLSVFRGDSEDANKMQNMLEVRQILQRGVADGTPVKLKSSTNPLQW